MCENIYKTSTKNEKKTKKTKDITTQLLYSARFSCESLKFIANLPVKN